MSEVLQPEDSPGLLLWRATLAWQRKITAALRPLGLTHVQFVLLASSWWLIEHGGEMPTQRRVADFAGTDVMMTSQVLRTLEAKELIRRTAADDDARAKVVTVTDAGRGLAAKAGRVVEGVDRAFFFGVETDAAVRLLRAVSA